MTAMEGIKGMRKEREHGCDRRNAVNGKRAERNKIKAMLYMLKMMKEQKVIEKI